MNNRNEKVVVTQNKYGGCIECIDPTNEVYNIIIRQGYKFATLTGNLETLLQTQLESGSIIYGGKIITKESFSPPTDDPSLCLKQKEGKLCKKNGKVIYSHSYFTYDNTDKDEIIKED